MRVNNKKESYLVCNRCGRRIPVLKGIPQEDIVTVDKSWGYFSAKDGVRIRFDLCEDCVEAITAGFQIPPEQEQETELFPAFLPEEK